MKFNREFKIENKVISDSSPVFIIAEAGVNHGGDMNLAKKLIDIAAEANVDAIKFQTFRTEQLILDNVSKAPYQMKTTNIEESQFNMLKSLEVSREQNIELKKYCDKNNIIFLTTPFDEISIDELDELDLPAYKVASTDTTNLPFLNKLAKKGKPIFLSTGMTYLSEIEIALQEIYKYNKDVVLLQCTANYPIEDTESNLNVINTFKEKFDVLVGYSDHTTGVGAAPFSIPMGAKVVEKHFTVDKTLKGPDHKASLSPKELQEFVNTIRTVEKYMGTYLKTPNLSETHTRHSLQKCFVAKTKINSGDFFSSKNIIAKRTGGKGTSPIYANEIFGKKAQKNYLKDEPIL